MMEFVGWDYDIPKIWKNKNVPNHQAVDDYGINVYTIYNIYIYMWNYMESCLGMEMDIGFKSIDSNLKRIRI